MNNCGFGCIRSALKGVEYILCYIKSRSHDKGLRMRIVGYIMGYFNMTLMCIVFFQITPLYGTWLFLVHGCSCLFMIYLDMKYRESRSCFMDYYLLLSHQASSFLVTKKALNTLTQTEVFTDSMRDKRKKTLSLLREGVPILESLRVLSPHYLMRLYGVIATMTEENGDRGLQNALDIFETELEAWRIATEERIKGLEIIRKRIVILVILSLVIAVVATNMLNSTLSLHGSMIYQRSLFIFLCAQNITVLCVNAKRGKSWIEVDECF